MAVGAVARRILYRQEIMSRQGEYSQAVSRAQQLQDQLRLWNLQWPAIVKSHPYWKKLQAETDLPLRFESWEEFRARMPVMTRTDIKRNCSSMMNAVRGPDFYRITGGTTAEPVQIPAWKAERRATRADTWMARGWYGIDPASRLFMIWGHSHLFGTGVKGWINSRLRKTDDWLLGYNRFPAYNLGRDALERAAREMIEYGPDYVIGYSVALDLFARANSNLRERLRGLGVKVVIGAAEGFPAPDSEALLEDLFSCPVAMEYGSVETDLVAHTHPQGGYQTFWRSYLVEAERETTQPGMKIRVTSLYDRCVPLVRYELGDEVEPVEEDDAQILLGLARFKRVYGRCNDCVVLSDGIRVHSEVFTHVVRGYREIDGYQVVQNGEEIKVLTLLRGALDPQLQGRIRSALGKVHPELASASIEKVDALRRTRAGKTPMVVRLEG